ncbi:MAG: formate--tetrahydrofolate ligase [Alphaproteobacteria bacterium]|nr:formate--tetrahydrofolate ligase [Alphaproteobacteria bacterium]
MLSDIEISQQNNLEPITKIAEKIGLNQDNLELYGKYKAKLSFDTINRLTSKKSSGKLILVTALTPTPAGEGKSTISIGLADGLQKIGKKSILALREPSMGPCFGLKGGATGGGYAQIVPMEEINLHFTGDIHAITAANNLLAAMIDNHIKQGNTLGLNPNEIRWNRCLDLNDRALREIQIALGSSINGTPRYDHFDISVASEIMAIFCLAENLDDLKNRIKRIVIGKTFDGRYVTAGEINAHGAMTALLKDAIKPNIVQTLEKTPALVHGGPFANIAHGCNSIIATKTALKLADYVVTEAGFGADLGAEKFLDIKCRIANLKPDAAVIVATIRALKMHGGVAKDNLKEENVLAVKEGFANLKTHIENMQKYGLPIVVAINRFITDSTDEIKAVEELCHQNGVEAIMVSSWEHGGDGAKDLAQKVVEITNTPNNYAPIYDLNKTLKQKIETVAKEIYRAGKIEYSETATKKLAEFELNGYSNLPVCIAKTQNSISADSKLIGAPQGHLFEVKDVRLSAGAGFVVVLAGNIMTMPGLPVHPAAENIDVDEYGKITGLF